MAYNAFLDAFNIGTGAASSTVPRTGYGFTPKACIYFWSGQTGTVDVVGRLDYKGGIGVACSSTDRRFVVVQSDDGPTTTASNRKQSAAGCLGGLTIAGADDGEASLQSFDSDGQTLVINSAFTTNIRVHAAALGGTDLTNAATFQFQAPTATGNADVTSLSFQPDALLLFSVGSATAPPTTTTHAIISVGMATGASNQGVAATMDTHNVGTSVTGRYAYTGECVALHATATTLSFRASFVSFLSNGFRLNWLEVDGTTQPYVFGLALQGGSYSVGNVAAVLDTTTTIPVTGLGFDPVAALFLSHGAVTNTQDTPVTTSMMSLGAMTSATSRGVHAWGAREAQGFANNGATVQHDEVYASLQTGSIGALNALMDIQSVDTGGWTGIMDDADTVAARIFYLAIGAAAGGGGPATTPMRPVVVSQAVHQASFF